MVYLTCDNENCKKNGELMELTDEDDRSEWYEVTYECSECGRVKIHRREFDQLGLVISDKILGD